MSPENLDKSIKYIKDNFVPFTVGMCFTTIVLYWLITKGVFSLPNLLTCTDYSGIWEHEDGELMTIKQNNCSVTGNIKSGLRHDLKGEVIDTMLNLEIQRIQNECLQIMVATAELNPKNKLELFRDVDQVIGKCPDSSIQPGNRFDDQKYIKKSTI